MFYRYLAKITKVLTRTQEKNIICKKLARDLEKNQPVLQKNGHCRTKNKKSLNSKSKAC